MASEFNFSNSKFDVNQRVIKLKALLHAVIKSETLIFNALLTDLYKSAFEAYATETAYVISELRYVLANLSKWTKPQRVKSSVLNFPSSDHVYYEPYGRVLIIAPWNYPFQLSIVPLIAAVAAGNQVVLKPSELTPNTASIIETILKQVFDQDQVEVIQGGPDETQALLRQKWDYIFFTGSTPIGKIVAQMAAINLTPVTLELGGKSPCVVHESANLHIAAKRIVWGKFLNAGQTCIAPDYIVVHKSVQEKLVAFIIAEIKLFFGLNPQQSDDYGRIVNDKHFSRLLALLDSETIVHGGQFDQSEKYLSPTVVLDPKTESNLMKEEIFGPILPVLSYDSITSLQQILNKWQNPLAFYVFASDMTFAKNLIEVHSFGGGCINDVVLQVNNRHLPFGGRGQSGMGSYHGKYGFDTFSHKKAILKRGTWLDPSLRYPPYRSKLPWLRKIMNWF
jgi:aldehyde dehydrogenase (NAD+)